MAYLANNQGMLNKKRLSQKGSLFILLIINNIKLITFHIYLMVNWLKICSFGYEKIKNKIQALSSKSNHGTATNI